MKKNWFLNHLRQMKRREIVIFGVFSAVFAALQVSGSKIHLFQRPYFEDYNAKDLFAILVLSIFAFIFFDALFHYVKKRARMQERRRLVDSLPWIKYALIIFAGWLPWFLVYLPGGVGVDTLTSIMQALGDKPIINDNPVLHTISLIPFVHLGRLLGNLNLGIAVYVFVQMVALSAILGMCVQKINARVDNELVKWGILVFYSLNPVVAVFSITVIKDTPFSVFVLAFVLNILDIVESDGEYIVDWRGKIKFVLITFFVAFSRVNGFLVVLVGLSGLIIYFGKRNRKQRKGIALLLTGIGLILYGPLYDWLGISTPRAATEALSVPIQQISYAVVSNGDISEADMAFVEDKIMSKEQMMKSFTPHTVDGIKFAKGYHTAMVNENKMGVIRTWLSIMRTNQYAYLKAWLMETKGYYHIEPTAMPCVFLIAENDLGIENMKITDRVTGIPIQDYATWIQSRIARMCSIGLMMTVIWFCVCCLLINKNNLGLCTISPIIGIWISLMIGAPVYGEFRYIYPAFLAFPLILILTVESFQDSNTNS